MMLMRTLKKKMLKKDSMAFLFGSGTELPLNGQIQFQENFGHVLVKMLELEAP